MPTFYHNYWAMKNTADLTGGKLIAVWSQSISGVCAINPLVFSHPLEHSWKKERGAILLFCPQTPQKTNRILNWHEVIEVMKRNFRHLNFWYAPKNTQLTTVLHWNVIMITLFVCLLVKVKWYTLLGCGGLVEALTRLSRIHEINKQFYIVTCWRL
jgi:hypothetical protein